MIRVSAISEIYKMKTPNIQELKPEHISELRTQGISLNQIAYPIILNYSSIINLRYLSGKPSRREIRDIREAMKDLTGRIPLTKKGVFPDYFMIGPETDTNPRRAIIHPLLVRAGYYDDKLYPVVFYERSSFK